MNRTLAFALLVAACAESAAPPPAINQHAGTRWVMNEGGADAPTIEFADSRVSGHAGCNRWFAQVAVDGETIHFTAIGATRRACPPPQMALEQRFLEALSATQTGRLEDGMLVLRNAEERELARFTRDR